MYHFYHFNVSIFSGRKKNLTRNKYKKGNKINWLESLNLQVELFIYSIVKNIEWIINNVISLIIKIHLNVYLIFVEHFN